MKASKNLASMPFLGICVVSLQPNQRWSKKADQGPRAPLCSQTQQHPAAGLTAPCEPGPGRRRPRMGRLPPQRSGPLLWWVQQPVEGLTNTAGHCSDCLALGAQPCISEADSSPSWELHLPWETAGPKEQAGCQESLRPQ